MTALNGTLSFKLNKMDPVEEDVQHKSFQVTISLAGHSKTSKKLHGGQNINQTLNFDLKDVDPKEKFHIEVHGDNKHHHTPVYKYELALPQFVAKTEPLPKALTHKESQFKLHLESHWTPKTTTQKLAGEGAEQAKQTVAAVVTPSRALVVPETHRPWFMRASYYYDTTKNVYNYTTSFRVIAPVARFGENTANTILQKVVGKSLADLDGQLVAPSLNSLDNTVDATISTVIVKLVEGQNYVLKKKDDALSTVGKAKDYTVSTASSVVGSTLTTVGKAKDYTTASVKSVTSSTYNTVVSVTDYTTTQVANVSSSAYGKVRGATVYVVSHVPYLGAKIRA